MNKQLYNKIINNIAKTVKHTINESLFDDKEDDFINNDDNIVTLNIKDEMLPDIIEKINNNINLNKLEKDILWSRTDEFTVNNKDSLRRLIIQYIKKGITNFNFINVSEITDMSKLFYDFHIFDNGPELIDLDISEWDVSNVTNMFGMFYLCDNLNIDISNWDVSNVTNMGGMFFMCKRFNSDLSKWDVSNVTDMAWMFYNCENFDSDLSKWDVSNVTNMVYMFGGCLYFNANISNWNVSKVKGNKSMSMFTGCKIRDIFKPNFNK